MVRELHLDLVEVQKRIAHIESRLVSSNAPFCDPRVLRAQRQGGNSAMHICCRVRMHPGTRDLHYQSIR